MGWLIELKGDLHDLRVLQGAFPVGSIFVKREEDGFFLTGEDFAPLTSPESALSLAEQALDEFAAITMVFNSDFEKPKLDAVYSEDESGKRSKYLFASMHAKARARVHADAVIEGNDPCADVGPTEAQRLLDAARRATNAQAALMIWSDSVRTWPRLYRILEELEVELKMTVSKAGLCTDDQRGRFTRSANSAEVAGNDARHPGGKFEPPPKPMSLDEAVSFVGALIRLTLLRVKAGGDAV